MIRSVFLTWCVVTLCTLFPSKASAQEPVVAVAVDSDAFDRARVLILCLLDFKRLHREERANPENLARLNRQELVECQVAERQNAILDRLRIANPGLTEPQLRQEFQRIVLLAAFADFPGSESNNGDSNAPNN